MKFKKGDRVRIVGQSCEHPCDEVCSGTGTIINPKYMNEGQRFVHIEFDDLEGDACSGFVDGDLKLLEVTNWKELIENER